MAISAVRGWINAPVSLKIETENKTAEKISMLWAEKETM